jgi:hypothetical protein
VYYCRFKTRGAGAEAQGSPAQALDYISDGHDEHDRAAYSAPELEYIARSGDGWKVELEGGPVPVVAHGRLAASSAADLRQDWLDSCQPYHDKRATTGYLSWTFSIPKELSLLAEGRREPVREALQSAVRSVLGEAFDGLDFSAISAVHTRNSSAEAHHHVHILISKFARDQKTGKVFSLNNSAFKRMTPAALRSIKAAWKREVDLQLERALGVQIEQTQAFGGITVTTKDGVRLPALTRNSRRVLEKLLAVDLPDAGKGEPKRAWIGTMDEQIFETCQRAPWDPATFCSLYEEKAARVESYGRRVETLKKAGYLDAAGAITPGFRLRMAAHTGELTPELFRLRIDLQRELDRQVAAGAMPLDDRANQAALLERYERALESLRERGLPEDSALGQSLAKLTERGSSGVDLWTAVERLESYQRRLDHLGVSKAAFARSIRHWESRVYPDLAGILKRGFASRDPQRLEDRELEELGKIIGKFFGGGWIPADPQPIVLRVISSTDTFQPGRISELFRVLARRQSPALDRVQAATLSTMKPDPRQDRKRERVVLASHATAVQMFQVGAQLLEKHRPDLLAALSSWRDRPAELVRRVQTTATGQEVGLTEEEYRAANTIGRVGRLLTEERKTAVPNPGPLDLLRSRASALGFTAPDGQHADAARIPDCIRALQREGLLEPSGEWTLAASTFSRILREHGLVNRPQRAAAPGGRSNIRDREEPQR